MRPPANDIVPGFCNAPNFTLGRGRAHKRPHTLRHLVGTKRGFHIVRLQAETLEKEDTSNIDSRNNGETPTFLFGEYTSR